MIFKWHTTWNNNDVQAKRLALPLLSSARTNKKFYTLTSYPQANENKPWVEKYYTIKTTNTRILETIEAGNYVSCRFRKNMTTIILRELQLYYSLFKTLRIWNKRQIWMGWKTVLTTYKEHYKKLKLVHKAPDWQGKMNRNLFQKKRKKRYTHLNFISFDSFKRVISVPCNALINWQEEEIQPIIVSPIQFW